MNRDTCQDCKFLIGLYFSEQITWHCAHQDVIIEQEGPFARMENSNAKIPLNIEIKVIVGDILSESPEWCPGREAGQFGPIYEYRWAEICRAYHFPLAASFTNNDFNIVKKRCQRCGAGAFSAAIYGREYCRGCGLEKPSGGWTDLDKMRNSEAPVAIMEENGIL